MTINNSPPVTPLCVAQGQTCLQTTQCCTGLSCINGVCAPPVVPSCACPAGVTEQTIPAQLGGQTLPPGCYRAVGNAAYGLTGTVTLNGAGQYRFYTDAALTTAAASAVVLTGGAACPDVQWCPGAAANIGGAASFAGNVQTGFGGVGPGGAITVGAVACVRGVLVASNGVVTIGAGAVVAPCGTQPPCLGQGA